MPTRGRQQWARRAIACFEAQTYPDKELIILDDHDDPSFPDMAAVDPHTYVVYFRRLSIPEKRNELCLRALGQIIMHWDSDDWSDSGRMADQVTRLEQSGKAMTGYHTILFHEPDTQIWGRYVLDNVSAFGTSLCYLKSWWAKHPFDEDLPIGEDNRAVMIAGGERQLIVADGTSMMVARVHAGNTSLKDMGNCRPVERAIIPKGFPA